MGKYVSSGFIQITEALGEQGRERERKKIEIKLLEKLIDDAIA